MAMEKRAVAALPWHLGPATVAEAALAEAYRWELVGVYSEAAVWKRIAAAVTANGPRWFQQAADLAALSDGVTGDAAVTLAENRAALMRGLIYYRSLGLSRQWDSDTASRPEAQQPAPESR